MNIENIKNSTKWKIKSKLERKQFLRDYHNLIQNYPSSLIDNSTDLDSRIYSLFNDW